MKKKLFLLPLVSAFVLTGCQISLFGKTFKFFEKDASSTTDDKKDPVEPVDEGEKFEFDFTSIDFPNFSSSPGSIQEFEYEGMTFYDRQTYYSDGNGALWFYNQWSGNYTDTEKGKQTNEDTVFAFISNQTAFEKPIKAIKFKTNAGTGGPAVSIATSDTPITDAKTDGKKVVVTSQVEKEYTVSLGSKSKYFSITAYNDVGYNLKNLMLDSLIVLF